MPKLNFQLTLFFRSSIPVSHDPIKENHTVFDDMRVS